MHGEHLERMLIVMLDLCCKILKRKTVVICWPFSRQSCGHCHVWSHDGVSVACHCCFCVYNGCIWHRCGSVNLCFGGCRRRWLGGQHAKLSLKIHRTGFAEISGFVTLCTSNASSVYGACNKSGAKNGFQAILTFHLQSESVSLCLALRYLFSKYF